MREHHRSAADGVASRRALVDRIVLVACGVDGERSGITIAAQVLLAPRATARTMAERAGTVLTVKPQDTASSIELGGASTQKRSRIDASRCRELEECHLQRISPLYTTSV